MRGEHVADNEIGKQVGYYPWDIHDCDQACLQVSMLAALPLAPAKDKC